MAAEQALGERVVLLGEIVAAGGGFGEADLGRAVVEPDLFGQRLGVELVGAGVDSLGDQALHRDQGVAGLGGPAPVAAGVSGVGHALQFAQRVRAAQLVGGIDVSVVRCPDVVHRNTFEVWQDFGGVDASGAAFGMTGDQGVADATYGAATGMIGFVGWEGLVDSS